MNEDIKIKLRRKIIKERKSILKSEKEQMDTKIAENLVNSGILTNAKQVLIYLSTEIEVDTSKIIDYCLEKSINVAVPRCVGLRKMDFYPFDKNTQLEKSKFGIFEPFENKENIIKNFDNTICIVPGLSFNKKGFRLGYGGGFYDTFLYENPDLKTIGICYKRHIINNIPIGEYDKKVNYIITEENMEVCNG